MNKLPVGQIVSEGWQVYKEKPLKISGMFLLAIIAIFAVRMGPTFLVTDGSATNPTTALAAQFVILGVVLQSYVSMGLMNWLLKVAKKEAVASKDFFPHAMAFIKYEVATWLNAIVVLLGYVLLLVPGILFSYMFSQVSMLMLDGNIGIFESFGRSREMMKKNWGPFSLLVLAVIGINLLGLLVVGVGLIVTIPLTSLIMMRSFIFLKNNLQK